MIPRILTMIQWGPSEVVIIYPDDGHIFSLLLVYSLLTTINHHYYMMGILENEPLSNEPLQILPSGQAMATALAFRLLQPLGKAAGAWGHLSSAPRKGTLRPAWPCLASGLHILFSQ